MLFGVYPFRCLKCNERFFGNVWILATGGHANCPKCLRLDVQPSVRRESHLTSRDRLMMTMGAHMYRCVPCRLNFFSFRKCIHNADQQSEDYAPVDAGMRSEPGVSEADG